MTLRKLCGLALFTFALAAVLGAAPAFAGQAPATPAPVPALVPSSANCGTPALAVPAPLSQAMTPAQPAATVPDFMEPARRKGYCHCGCSSVRTCFTSDDCGGASCDQFISCC
jgi:hypothetical protein